VTTYTRPPARESAAERAEHAAARSAAATRALVDLVRRSGLPRTPELERALDLADLCASRARAAAADVLREQTNRATDELRRRGGQRA